jgi:multiple sugar transport system substrate-binding protein
MKRRTFLTGSALMTAGLALGPRRALFAQGTPAVNEDVSGTVVYWSTYNTVSPEYQVLTEQVIPAFNARYPNVTIDAQSIPDSEMRQKLLTAAAGGETPDIARMDIVQVPEFAEMGALAAVDDLVPDWAAYAERFYPGPLATNTYDGKYYGVPLDTNTRVIFYNPALLEEAGIAAPPATFEEFNAAAQTLKDAGIVAYSEGGTSAWNMLPWIWSNGGGITNEDYTQASGVLNGEATVGAVQMVKDWLDNGMMSEAVFGGGLSTSQELAEGSVAMIIDGPWMPSIFAAQYPDFEYGLAPIPEGPGGSISVVGGENTVLFEASENKEASLAFALYMAEPEAQLAMATTGQMPVLKDLGDAADVPEYFPTFLQQLETAQPRTPSPEWTRIEDAVTAAIYQVVADELDAQTALDEAAAVVDGLLAG